MYRPMEKLLIHS